MFNRFFTLFVIVHCFFSYGLFTHLAAASVCEIAAEMPFTKDICMQLERRINNPVVIASIKARVVDHYSAEPEAIFLKHYFKALFDYCHGRGLISRYEHI